MHLAPMLWNLEGPPLGTAGFEAPMILPASGSQFRLRQYRDSDREEVRRICCDTGFLGNPVDPLFQDRELFADLFTNAYLDYEPEWTLVAESAGRVAGYLMGSVTPRFNRNLMRSGFQTTCKMLRRLLSGGYSQHPRSERFVRWVLTRGLMEQPKHPAGAAHLHINLEKNLRWAAVARRLLSTYEGMLMAAGVNHYYAKFFSCPQRNPERVYHRLGYKLYDRQETTLFRPEITDAVYTVCIHKGLRGAVRWQ
jgi:hypothetical protein